MHGLGPAARKKKVIMKKLFCLLALCFGVAVADAQITTGETTSKVIRTGNRAKAGDFGIYFGATTNVFKSIKSFGEKDGVEYSAMPLINLKYMKTDKLEYRLGLEWWKKSSSFEDKIPNYDEETGEERGTKKNEWSNGESRFTFYPGVAYHFSNKNLLDVYVGGELPFGWSSYSGEYDDEDYSTSQFRIGLGAFIGLQAYIGNLPLAVGVEYGLSTMYNTISDGSFSKDGMSIDYRAGEFYQEDHSESKWELGHQVRLTLSYYFNKT